VNVLFGEIGGVAGASGVRLFGDLFAVGVEQIGERGSVVVS
jgi:hypothetical protein